MKSAVDNMILKYLDKVSKTSVKDKISGLVKEFKLTEERAVEWIEKLYPHHKKNAERLSPRKTAKKNAHDY